MKENFNTRHMATELLDICCLSTNSDTIFNYVDRKITANCKSTYTGTKTTHNYTGDNFKSIGTVDCNYIDDVNDCGDASVEVLCKLVRFNTPGNLMELSKDDYRDINEFFIPSNSNVSGISNSRQLSAVDDIDLRSGNKALIDRVASLGTLFGYNELMPLGVILINPRLTTTANGRTTLVSVKASDVINRFIMSDCVSPYKYRSRHSTGSGRKSIVNNNFIIDPNTGEELIIIGTNETATSTFIPVLIYKGFESFNIANNIFDYHNAKVQHDIVTNTLKETYGLDRINTSKDNILVSDSILTHVNEAYMLTGNVKGVNKFDKINIVSTYDVTEISTMLIGKGIDSNLCKVHFYNDGVVETGCGINDVYNFISIASGNSALGVMISLMDGFVTMIMLHDNNCLSRMGILLGYESLNNADRIIKEGKSMYADGVADRLRDKEEARINEEHMRTEALHEAKMAMLNEEHRLNMEAMHTKMDMGTLSATNKLYSDYASASANDSLQTLKVVGGGIALLTVIVMTIAKFAPR